MTQRSKMLVRRLVAAIAILTTVAALIWIRSHHDQEAWYLNRPASWWSDQLVKYAYTHNSDPAMGLDFDRLGPAAPSPCNPLEHYLLSTLGKVRLRLGNDPPVDAIFDPEIEAIPLLVELLQDRNRYVRFYAHCALGGFEMRVFAKYLARDEVVRALEKAEHENSENEAGEQIRCVLRQIEGLKTDIDTFRLGKQ